MITNDKDLQIVIEYHFRYWYIINNLRRKPHYILAILSSSTYCRFNIELLTFTHVLGGQAVAVS